MVIVKVGKIEIGQVETIMPMAAGLYTSKSFRSND